MLVLARKTGQSIVLGSDIVVMVLEIRGDQVRLGISAPRSVPVHRKELLDQVVAQNIEAAAAGKETKDSLSNGHNVRQVSYSKDGLNSKPKAEKKPTDPVT